MTQEVSVVAVEAQIDRGLGYALWRDRQRVATKSYEEQMGLGTGERDPSFARVTYKVFDNLLPGDSVFIPAKYGMNESRSAAIGKARYLDWNVITRKTYEGGKLGVRVFRL